MATRARFRGVVAVMFAVFLVPVAAANVVVGELSFAVLFGTTAFLFFSFGTYSASNPDEFGDSDETVPDRWIRVVRFVGGAATLVAAMVVLSLVLG